MKVKKILTTLAATGLITATLAAPALAKEIEQPETTGDSTVNAKVAQTYTVVIPNTVSFGELNKESKDVKIDLTVTVSNLLIDKTQALKINVKGDDTTTPDAFTIRTQGGARIAYEVHDKSGVKVEPNGPFAAVTSAAAPDITQDVSGKLIQTGAVVNAGSYAGTIIFTCTVETTP